MLRPRINIALELYSGSGGLTKIYEQNFKSVITNDINENSVAQYKMPALNFIRQILSKIDYKIDLVDFDCYGSPNAEIKEFFELRKDKDMPLVLTLSDGLGLWMKRTKKIELIRQKYLLTNDFKFDEGHPWRDHQIILDEFMLNIAAKYGLRVQKIISVQTKFKNYTLGSWKFYKDKSVDN